MVEFLKEPFVLRAIVCGLILAILLSGLGLFLVLRRLSLIGDGLAHVSFGGVSLGVLLNGSPFYVAIPVCVLASIGILKIIKIARIHTDAALGIVSSLGIASGVILSTIGGGFNVEVFNYLFGSILSVTYEDVVASFIFTCLFLSYVFLFYGELVSTTFDEELAFVEGVNTERINTVLAVFTAVTVVMGMKIVGLLLVTSLLIIPPVTSLQFSKEFKTTFFLSIFFGVVSVVLGIALSLLFDVPAGSSIVLVNFCALLLAIAISRKNC